MNIFQGNLLDLNPPPKAIFPIPDNLTLIGGIPKTYSFIVECSVCKLDSELFKTGMFITTLGHLRSGKMPCGCSKNPKWQEYQQKIRVERILHTSKFSLVEYYNYQGQKTLVDLSCKFHGIWTTNISAIVNNKTGCRRCADENSYTYLRKPDEVMINSFMKTGCFPDGTLFSRSERKTSQGAKNYWKVYCPICDFEGESTTSDLQKGCMCCDCSKDFRETYLNLVTDNGLPIALKFGITKNFPERLYRQNLKSIFTVTNLFRWRYLNKSDCLEAEMNVKSFVRQPKLTKIEFPDGWTETCSIIYMEDIIKTFSEKGSIIY